MCCLTGLDELLHNILQLLAEEHGDDCGRCLVCPQSVIVADIRCTLAEQISVGVNCLHDAGKYQQELDVLVRCVAGIEQVHAIIGSQRPVVMLTGAVHTSKGLLMQQTGHAVTSCHLLHRLHYQLVVVYRNIRRLINRCKLMLCGSDLIVLGLSGNAQLPQFNIQILHVGTDALADCSEIVILKLLSLGSRCTGQCPSRKDQILTL